MENADPKLVSAFFEIGHPLIQAKIVYTGLLTRSQRDRAWHGGDVDVCRQLLMLPDFLYELTEDQARDIMAVKDLHMLQTLAGKIRYLYIMWDGIPERRLSPQARDELLNFLAAYPDNSVQRLFDRDGIPKEFFYG